MSSATRLADEYEHAYHALVRDGIMDGRAAPRRFGQGAAFHTSQ